MKIHRKNLDLAIPVITAVLLCIMMALFPSCNQSQIQNSSDFPNTLAENAQISDEYNEICQTISKDAIDEFKQVAKIPRKSGNMDKIKNYIMTWAKSNNINAVLDKSGCIYIDLPASPGLENNKNLIIQAHMDMVLDAEASNQKTEDMTIDLVEDLQTGEIHSKDYKTNIGADDAQGLCMCMSLAKHAKDFDHGPVRLLFTYDEETTSEGTKNLEADVLNADYLINFDNSRSGVCVKGCAGTFPINFDKKYASPDPTEKNASENLTIKLNGLKGGHSGKDITKPRVSASKIIIDYFNEMKDQVVNFRAASIDCGKANNAIPDSFTLTININKKHEEEAKTIFNDLVDKIKKDNPDDQDFEYQINVENASGNFPSKRDTDKIIEVLNCIPNGLIEKTSNNEAKTSCNLGIVTLKGGNLHCEALFRSSDKNTLEDKAAEITEDLKGKKIQLNINENNKDPVWEPSETSLLKMYENSIKDNAKITPLIVTNHSFLEPSIFVQKKPGMQCISIGGDVKDEHMNTETFYTKSFPVSILPVVYILSHSNELN